MRLLVMKLFAEIKKSSFPVSRKQATNTLLIYQQQGKNENFNDLIQEKKVRKK